MKKRSFNLSFSSFVEAVGKVALWGGVAVALVKAIQTFRDELAKLELGAEPERVHDDG